MSSSSSTSSEDEIRVDSKLKSSVSNVLKQPPNKMKMVNNSILQKGILNKDIQNILNKVNSRNKNTAQKKYEIMSSSDSETSLGNERVEKINKTREHIPNKPVLQNESDSDSSDSVEEIKFPGPKIIKEEADLASYRPGLDRTDIIETLFPKPIKIKKEPGVDKNDRIKNKKYLVSTKRVSHKQNNSTELTDDSIKVKHPRDREPSSKIQKPENFMNGLHEEFEKQPLDSEDDDKFVEKIEAAVEKKSKINVLQNVTLNKPSTPKDQLSDLHPNLEHLKNKIDLDFAEADLYLLMIPNSVDPHVLLNQDSIHENCKIKVGKKYSLRSSGKIPDPCLLLSNNNKIIQFKDNIVMSHYIKKQKMPEIDVVPKEPVRMPENLKNRHPLFGSLFEEHIQLSGETQQKLDEAVKNKLSSVRKSKKKKEKKSKAIQELESEEIIYNLLNVSKPSSLAFGSTKGKVSKTTYVEQQIPSPAIDGAEKKSSKKRKRTSYHDEQMESVEISDKEHVLALKGRNKADVKKERFSEYETDAEPPTKKKKRKSNDKKDLTEANDLDQQSSLVQETNLSVKKKKADIKKESHTDYETDIDPPLKKKKKKKTNNLEPVAFTRFDNLDVSEEIESECSPRRSKNIKMEIFTEYETEVEASEPKRKKKKSKTFETVPDEQLSKSGVTSTEIIAENETDINLKDHKRKKHKSKKLKSEPLTEYETDTEITSNRMEDTSVKSEINAELSSTKKKKKKNGNIHNLKKELLTEYETDAEVGDMNIKKELMIEYETDVDNVSSLKKKRKKPKDEVNRRISLANSTLKTDISKRPSFSPDVSYIHKDNFKQNDEYIDVIDNSLIDSLKIDFKRSKKMKKEVVD